MFKFGIYVCLRVNHLFPINGLPSSQKCNRLLDGLRMVYLDGLLKSLINLGNCLMVNQVNLLFSINIIYMI